MPPILQKAPLLKRVASQIFRPGLFFGSAWRDSPAFMPQRQASKY
jgi:hypothetical protein